MAAQLHSSACNESATGSLWFPPSVTSIFSGFALPGSAAQQPQPAVATPAGAPGTQGERLAAAAPARAPPAPELAPSADLTALVETVRGDAPNSYESSRRISGILERVALQLDTLPPAHTTVLVAALCELEKRDAIVDIMLEAVRSRRLCAHAVAAVLEQGTGAGTFGMLPHRKV